MNELELLRAQIDELDKTITECYAKRLQIVHKIGEYKKNNNVNVLDQNREQKVYDNVAKYSKEYKEEVKDLYTYIMQYSKMKQRNQ